MSAIHQRAPGVFLIAIDHGTDPATGKRKRKWHTFKGSKRAAKAEAARLTAEFAGGQYIEPSKLTVGQFLEQWLEAVKPNVSPKTHERYRELVRNNVVPLLGQILLRELKGLQIAGALAKALERGRRDGGPLSRRTVRHMHVVLKGALQWAVDVAEILPKNPAAKVEPPRVQELAVETYDMPDTVRLIALLRERGIFMPVYLSARTGMRRGETAALSWRNIDLERAAIKISASVEQLNNSVRIKSTKSERIRVLKVDQDIVATLRAHKATQAETLLELGIRQTQDTLVCAHHDGRMMHPRWISKQWAKLVRESGLPVRNFHHLRHAYATAMLSAGIHIKVASERLGHSTTGITLDLYSHVLPGIQQEAADRIGEAFQLATSAVAEEESSDRVAGDTGEAEMVAEWLQRRTSEPAL